MVDDGVTHGYWVLHTRAIQTGEAPVVAGVLEDLVTGSRQTFESLSEMSTLINAWAARGAAASERGKER